MIRSSGCSIAPCKEEALSASPLQPLALLTHRPQDSDTPVPAPWPLCCPVISSWILSSGASSCRIERGYHTALQPTEMFPCGPEHPREEPYSLTAAWQPACFLGHKARQTKCFPKRRIHRQNTSQALPPSRTWLLQPLLCCDPAMPGQQQHPQPARPGSLQQSSSQLEGISLNTQSLQLLLLQNLSQLLDVLSAGDSMSPIHLHPLPRAQPLPVLLQSRDVGCDTQGGYSIGGTCVEPHRCLPHTFIILPAA